MRILLRILTRFQLKQHSHILCYTRLNWC